MPSSITITLVGAHFRPPAKAIISSLPAGCQLRLEAEPENPYDPKAIQVWVRGELCEREALEIGLAGTGFDVDDVLVGDWQLGFLPDSDGKACKASALPGNREAAEFISAHPDGLVCWLAFAPDGKPEVILTATDGKA